MYAEPAAQRTIFNYYILIGVIYCSVFVPVFFWLLHDAVLGWIHVAAFGGVVASWVAGALAKRYVLGFHIILIDGAVVVLSLYATGGVGGAGYLWVFAYVPYAALLTRKRQVWFWTGLLLVGSIVITMLGGFQLIHLPYSPLVIGNYFFAYIVFAGCILVCKTHADRMDDTLREQQAELTAANVQLKREVALKECSNQELAIKHHEAEHAKAKAEIILNNIPEGLIIFDDKAQITRVNRAALDMLGYAEQSVIGVDLESVLVARDVKSQPIPRAERPIIRTLATRQQLHESLCYTRQDGAVFDAQVASSPLVVDGRLVGAIQVFHDITREKALDRSKTEFVSLASHQLRTPASIVKWGIETLVTDASQPLNKAQHKVVRMIDQANERMIKTIETLLHITRLEAGKTVGKPQRVDLGPFLAQELAAFRTYIRRKKLQTTLSCKPTTLHLSIEPDYLQIIVHNLLANAVKYTPKGGSITITIEERGPGIRLTVADTGCGIPPSQQSQIFHKFFRAENAQSIDPDGNGLGLYLVKLIVNCLSGTISFTSAENEGTTFYVAIPTTKPDELTGVVADSSP